MDITMSSEIERTAREIGEKKGASEIERTAQEIEIVCDKFVKLNEDLVRTGEQLDTKTQDKLEKISRVLKNFYIKSSGIRETWRLNERQYEEGRLERDAYEKKLRELTENISSLRFDFHKCAVEIEAFERRVSVLFNLSTASLTLDTGEKKPMQSTIDSEAQEALGSAKKISLSRDKVREEYKEEVGDPEAYIRLGISYAQSKKPAKAKECFESALTFKPRNATVWFHLGHANSALNNYAEAAKCYSKVLEINPKHTAALCDLGFSYGQLGKHKQARKCYNPNDAKAWTGLGVTLYSLGRFKQAKECIEKAIQVDPKFALAWYNLGLVYSSLGYHQESKRCYDQAKKLGYQ
jgi:tetratricopeptide (TPR) repeat protein